MAHNGLNPGQRRDNRRQRLYTAEDVLRGKRVSRAAQRYLLDTITHPTLRVLPTFEEGLAGARPQPYLYPSIPAVQAYVDHLTGSAWWQRRWGGHHIDVRASQGANSNARGSYEIRMGAQHRRSEAVILHEVAHCLTSSRAAHHGPEFAGILLTLVRHVMGAEHGDALRDSFREHSVRYTMAEVPTPSAAMLANGRDCARRRAAKR